jgi:hypothetical protein
MTRPSPDPPPPPKADPAAVAWGQAHLYLDRLFDVLEKLEEAGGIRAAAESSGWTPKARRRAEATLAATHAAIGRQLEQLRGRKGRT